MEFIQDFDKNLHGLVKQYTPQQVVEFLKLDMTESYPVFEDIHIVLIASIWVTVWRFVVEDFVVKPLVPRLTHIKRSKHVQKFAVETFKLVYYTIYTTIGYLLLRNTPWFSDLNYCWNPYPNSISFNVRFYYLTQLGFYVHSIVTHVWYETKKKDFMEMLIHHVVTFGLITFSYTSGYERIGTMILLIHDATDVPIGLTKLAKYLKYDRTTLVFFTLMVGMWTWLRLYYFPFHILHSTSVQLVEQFIAQGVIPEGTSFWDWSVMSPLWVPQFNMALGVLVCLHIFWYSLFIRMAYMALSEVPDDVRSESDTESESESKKQK